MDKIQIHTKSPEEIAKEDKGLIERRYNSLVEAALNLQDVNENLRAEILICHQKMAEAQINVDINKKIVMDSILGQNRMKDEFAMEIGLLKDKLNKAQVALEA